MTSKSFTTIQIIVAKAKKKCQITPRVSLQINDDIKFIFKNANISRYPGYFNDFVKLQWFRVLGLRQLILLFSTLRCMFLTPAPMLERYSYGTFL